MATFDDLFSAYYTQYRTEAVIPASTDDEYTIFLRLANEAVNRWSRYDGTYWKELYTTLQNSTQVSPALVKTITVGTLTYTAPADMREAGGFVKIKDSNNNTVRSYAIIETQDVQFKDGQSQYCYFTGNPTQGFTLNLNPAPDTAISGMKIDYVYYKKPTFFVAGGTETSEMNDPYFIIHRALASRFRGSRNPFRNDAKADAEDVLKTMQADNNSGNWADPWKLQDNSGSTWGQDYGGDW